VFVHGFSFTRSVTHPYLAERVGPLWVMRDAPRKRGNYRNEEWVAYGVAPEEINEIVRAQARGRFAICMLCGLDQTQEPLRTAFKRLDYRLGLSEPLMVHSLARIPHFDSPARIERVTSVEMAERLAKAARTRQILPEQFASDSPLRQYVARIDDELVGWVASMVVGEA